MKESIFETLMDEIKHIPDDWIALRHVIQRASKGELKVELSNLQYGIIKKELREATAPLYTALMLVLGALGGWIAGSEEIAYVLLGAAILRLWFR
jgi:hypothetical protein